MTKIYCAVYLSTFFSAPVAQPVEHVLGKDEVTGSRPVGGLIVNFGNKKCEKIFSSNVRNAAGLITVSPKTKNKTPIV